MKKLDKLICALMCIYAVVLPLVPSGYKIKGIPISGDIVFALIVLAYLVKTVSSRENLERFFESIKDFITSSTSIFMIILLAMMLFSVTYATDKGIARSESVRFFTYIILYFIVKYEFDKKAVDWVTRTLIALSAFLGVYGIFQHFTGFGLPKIFKVNGVVRIAGTFVDPNTYAGFIILAIFPLIMLCIQERNLIKKSVYGLISVLLFSNMILTQSRNALLAFLIGCIILVIIYSRKLLILLAGFSLLSLLVPFINRRVRDFANHTQDITRIKLWKTALKMIKEHPLLGVGNGNFVTLYDSYIAKYKELFIYSEYTHYPSHNSYLKVESELGVVGITSFLGVIISVLLRIKKFLSNTEDEFYKFFYTGYLASVIAFLFMNIFDNLFFVPKTTAFFWLLFSMAEALMYSTKKSGIWSNKRY